MPVFITCSMAFDNSIHLLHPITRLKRKTINLTTMKGKMRDFIQLLISTVSELFSMFLAFFIPFVLYQISGKLYEVGNPSWKRKEDNE